MIVLNEFPWLYGMQCGAFIKIGVAKDIRLRLRDFQLANPHQIKVVLKQMCDEAYWLERRMHQILKPQRYRREWFEIDVDTAKAALAASLDDLAEKRRKQIAWEIQKGEWGEQKHPLAAWTGTGICRPHPVTDWNI